MVKLNTNKSNIDISVVIVNYNTGDLVARTIKNLSSMDNLEIIVIDNNSTDNSVETINSAINSAVSSTNKDATVQLITNTRNLGFGKATNMGVEKSHGNYICILNPDVDIKPKNITEMLNFTKSKPNSILAPRLKNKDGTTQPSCYRKQSITNAIREFWFKQHSAYSKYIPQDTNNPTTVYSAVGAVWFMRRETWDKIGGFNTKFFLYFEDIEFCDRANKLGVEMIYNPNISVTHYHGVSSKTNPETQKLFIDSAHRYHGKLKKYMIDIIIRSGNLFHRQNTYTKLFALYISILFLYYAIASMGYFLLPSRYQPLDFINKIWKSNFLIWSWSNFDGEHYLSIAKYGYRIRNSFPQYAFFPLFPLLINILAKITHDYFIAGRVLTFIFGFTTVLFIHKWLTAINVKHKTRILLLIMLFPGSVFLHATYTEPLFLTLVFATAYFVEKKDWIKASLLAGLSTATRVNGVFLSLFVLISIFKESLSSKNGLKTSLIKVIKAIPMTIYGILGYTYYLYIKTGNALSFYTAQKSWGKADPTPLTQTIMSYAKAVTLEFKPDLTHMVVLIEVLSLTLGVYLIIAMIRSRRLGIEYITYITLNMVLPLMTGSLGSIHRFMLSITPSFIIFDSWNAKKLRFVFMLYILILSFGIILFTRGYWYA